jgi:phytoene desaturase
VDRIEVSTGEPNKEKLKKHFIVVGAGMGGLAIALRLAHEGYKVTVLEKTGDIGGRNRVEGVNGCRFDGGPTLLMMLEPFRRLFEDVGESFDEKLSLTKMDPGYRVFYRDGLRLESSPDSETMEATICQHFGSGDATGYRRLMTDLKSMYDEAIPGFVRKNYHKPLEFLSLKSLSSAIRHRMMGNLAKGVERYVQDPRLRMLFSFQTMYLGLSPFEAPWVYATLTYMEFGEGIFYPDGGLARIPRVIAELACQRGATIRLESPVAKVEHSSVMLCDGQKITGDAVIVNADLPYAYEHLTSERLKPKTHSCSASVHYLDYQGDLPELLHHNVFFGRDFKDNLDDIFQRNALPKDPAFYVAISSKSDASMAPSGHLNLMILIPCPNLDYPWSEESEAKLLEQAFERLSMEVGFDRTKVVGRKSMGPVDYRNELNLGKGAAFGLSHHIRQSALFRPGNRSRKYPNVYFVGASTIPGNGLPMVLISAELAAERIKDDLKLNG